MKVIQQARRIVGFAVLVQEWDGSRLLIFSDDVDGGTFTMNQETFTLEGDDDVINRSTVDRGYEVHLRGHHIQMRREAKPITELLEEKPKLLNAKNLLNG